MKIISLFCGAGGLDLGFKEAGFESVLASDIMSHAESTYKKNFPETKFIKKDTGAVHKCQTLENCRRRQPTQGATVQTFLTVTLMMHKWRTHVRTLFPQQQLMWVKASEQVT